MPKAVDLSAAVETDINRQHPETPEPPAPLPGPPTRGAASPEPEAPEPRPETVETAAAPRPGKSGRSRRTQRSAPSGAATERTKELQVTVPRSLVERADQDDRSRSDILRHAFNRHAEHIDTASTEAPAGPMGAGRRTRRKAAPDDPFVPIMLRLTPAEIALLDEVAESASDSRSGLVSALFRLELS